MKVYGPFDCKDGRKRVTIHYDDGSKRTITYAKWLVEQSIGRQIDSKNHVHHKDGDFTNDTLSNLEVLNGSQHIINHRIGRPMVTLTCKECGKVFQREARRERANRKQGKRGPYCSRSCVGKAYY